MALLLSIIIPLYNKQDCILKTLNSVLSQEFSNYEIIIVDDGSTDNSVQVVESISDKRIRLFRKGNGGPASARNYGVRKAQGEWVLFLDADDTLVENMLNKVVENIHKRWFADVFTYNQYIKIQGQQFLRRQDHDNGYVLFPFLSYYKEKIYPGPGRTVLKRAVLLKEPFREELLRYEDTELFFRLMRKYRFYACPTPLFCYNQDTLCASHRRENIKEDFICNLSPKGKSLFEQISQFKLYKEACQLYPQFVGQLYGDVFKKKKISNTIFVISLWDTFKGKLVRLIAKSYHLFKSHIS